MAFPKSLSVEEPQDIDYARRYLSAWSGYFKKPIQDRLKSVHNDANQCGALPLNVADIMVENCIGTLSLPLGISPNFVINNQHFIVPYSVEEPSIIAAASSISKLIAQNGGFRTASSDKNVMIGQVQILNVHPFIEKAMSVIQQNEAKYIKMGNNQYCLSMLKRGGGIIKIEPRVITPRIYAHKQQQRAPYLVVHIHLDVCDAMGANKVNTVCEGLSSLFLADLLSQGLKNVTIGLKILSNLCVHRMTKSLFCIPIAKLAWKGTDGMVVAHKIIEAYEFAVDDVYRATTNNKGIMNGMDAVAVALGQDWRAIEAAAHCYASVSNPENIYGPLAHYYIAYSTTRKCDCLYGYLELPISVGTKGGSITTHPGYKYTVHQLLTQQHTRTRTRAELGAKDIAAIIVSAGLASNFGAVRALAIEGIQKGHMALHSKNIASTVLDAQHMHLVDEVSQFMTRRDAIHTDMAQRYVSARSIEFDSTMDAVSSSSASAAAAASCAPNTLMVEMPSKSGPIVLDVVVQNDGAGGESMHLDLKVDERDNIVLNLHAGDGSEQKNDEVAMQRLRKVVMNMKKEKAAQKKSTKRSADTHEQQLYNDNMIAELFGMDKRAMVKRYHLLDSLNIVSQSSANNDHNDDEKVKDMHNNVAKIKLAALLLSILAEQHLVKYNSNGMADLNAMQQSLQRLVVDTYFDSKLDAFEAYVHALSLAIPVNNHSKKSAVMNNNNDGGAEHDATLYRFSQNLMRSLLKIIMYRVKELAATCNAGNDIIGVYLLMPLFGMFNALRYKYDVRTCKEGVTIVVDTKNVTRSLYSMVAKLGCIYPVHIFLTLNAWCECQWKTPLPHATKLSLLQCSNFLQRLLVIYFDAHNANKDDPSNVYTQYLKAMNKSKQSDASLFLQSMIDSMNNNQAVLNQSLLQQNKVQKQVVFDTKLLAQATELIKKLYV